MCFSWSLLPSAFNSPGAPAALQITSLLLLAMKQLPESLAQFDAHIRLLR